MSKFSPPKAKRPTNLWALLPSPKSAMTTTTTITRTANSTVATTSFPISSICKTCKRWGPPYPFCIKSALHPSPQESDWSNEDWDGNRQRARQQKKEADSNLTTTIDTTTTAAQTALNHQTNSTTTPICKMCKTMGDPCPFSIKPAPPPLT